MFISVILSAVLSSGIAARYVFADEHEWIPVRRIIDGDTFLLADGERIRLIGIDTPEIHASDKLYREAKRTKKSVEAIKAMGRRSKEFVDDLVGRNPVRLEFDVEKRDKYGRLLAYVYLKDGTFVNAEIIRQGYAQLLTVAPNVKHAELFLKLQREARENKRGLWKE